MPKINTRRAGREAALQFLFSQDLNEALHPQSPDAESFWQLRPAKGRVKAFAEELLSGIEDNREAIDAAITAAVENYAMYRIEPVDRNLLRLAAYELLFRDDIPAPVSIDEAIEIAKRFGSAESPAFINGILDRIRRENAGKK